MIPEHKFCFKSNELDLSLVCTVLHFKRQFARCVLLPFFGERWSERSPSNYCVIHPKWLNYGFLVRIAACLSAHSSLLYLSTYFVCCRVRGFVNFHGFLCPFRSFFHSIWRWYRPHAFMHWSLVSLVVYVFHDNSQFHY